MAIVTYQLTFFQVSESQIPFAFLVIRAKRSLPAQFPSAHATASLIVGIFISIGANICAAADEPHLGAARKLPINLEFSIGDIEFSPSFRFRGISARCTMLAYSSEQLHCNQATLLIKDSPLGLISMGAQFAWHANTQRWVVSAKGSFGATGKLKLDVDRSDVDTLIVMALNGFDVALLPKIIDPLPPNLADYDIESGTLKLNANCHAKGHAAVACDLEGRLETLNVNGVNVAENATMDFGLAYATGDASTLLNFSVSLTHGAVYVEPGFTLGGINPGFFLAVTDQPIDISSQIVIRSDEVRILNAHISHPSIMDMRFTGDLTFTPSLQWKNLDFSLHAPEVTEFYTTYMQPIALNTAFSSLEAIGSVSVDIVGADNMIDGLDLHFGNVHIDDEAGRFSLYGLDGGITLHAGEEIRRSHLDWLGAAVYRIEIGPGRIDWESASRNLKVASWKDVTIFDGEFRMDALEVTNFSTADTKVALAGSLSPITLSALTSAFDWLPLSGKVSGTIPRLSYEGDHLEMDGDLRVNIFDGEVIIQDLQVDELFSTLPVLAANVRISQLDLEELTRAISFGNISGRVDGKIADLELQAWRPTHFDAAISTPRDDDSPHRISRQAVDNLGRLGAGTGGALSQGWLGLIPSYSYGRLGLSCRLVNGYCLMGGVGDAADGSFSILTRGGILPPWIGIKGSGRRIKWQTLVDGIKQISEGNWELDVGS